MTHTIADEHKSYISILVDDGSITVPEELLTALNIKAGDQLVLTMEEDGFVVRPYSGDLV